ncbi:YybS family protein [Peribacillus sp. SI8-4]|uniref:YybS family protein n=1 Tax=Peribacillus sp. SI8-4 TaxID=3048009 RepID=UPI002553FB74|nr:YybS family protein [Peribacillus sp. SI8-4]
MLNNGRRIAEGGALLALYCIVLFISVHVPLLSIITFFFLPTPFILFASKQKFSWSLGYLFIASLLTLLVGSMVSVPLTLLMGVTGIAIGYCLKKDKPMATAFISAVLVFLGGIIIIYAASVLITNVNYIDMALKMLKETTENPVNIMGSLEQAQTEEIKTRMNDFIDMFYTLMPSLFVLMSVLMVLLIFLAAHPILKRFSEKALKWPHFRDLRLPKSLLWYYLITMLLALFANTDKDGFVYMAITNLFFILQFFMSLQGYSLIFYFAHVKSWAKAIPVMILVVTLLFPLPIITTVIRFLGIMDLGFPFRETFRKKG